MWNDLKPITEETGQRILSAVSGVDAQGKTSGWNNLKPMTEETGRKIVDALQEMPTGPVYPGVDLTAKLTHLEIQCYSRGQKIHFHFL